MSDAKKIAQQRAMERRKQNLELNVDALFQQIIAGSKNALSQGITLVESKKAEHQAMAQALIEKCLPHTGKSLRVGITGVPGVGKSTFIEAFGLHLVSEGHKPAVLAIDPSSGKTGGSILGDKTRMEELGKNENVFIRPSPTSDSLGGVARKTRESILLCEAAGFDYILIETVGVGQSETQVKSMCDFFLLLMLAGAGDELQGIKRGIMELADALMITKADSGNENNAIRAANEYRNALHLFPANDNLWQPYVGTSSSMEKRGMDRLLLVLKEFQEKYAANWIKENRLTQNLKWFEQSLAMGWENFLHRDHIAVEIETQKKLITAGKASAYMAAKRVLEVAFKN